MNTLGAFELQGESNQQRPNSPKAAQAESVRCHIKHGQTHFMQSINEFKIYRNNSKGA